MHQLFKANNMVVLWSATKALNFFLRFEFKVNMKLGNALNPTVLYHTDALFVSRGFSVDQIKILEDYKHPQTRKPIIEEFEKLYDNYSIHMSRKVDGLSDGIDGIDGIDDRHKKSPHLMPKTVKSKLKKKTNTSKTEVTHMVKSTSLSFSDKMRMVMNQFVPDGK
jgi:hypothetical protein